MRAFWCSVALAFIGVALAAQAQPDFSGRWVLVDPARPDPDVARALTIRQPIARATAYGEPMPPAFLELTVERQLESTTRTEHYTNGSESGSVGATGDQGYRTHTSVAWRENHLYIDTSTSSGPLSGPQTRREHSEEWSLDDRGRLVIVVVDRDGDALPTLQTLTYRRN